MMSSATEQKLKSKVEELERSLMAKQGEVSNLRAKLSDRDKEILRLQSTNLDLAKNSRGGQVQMSQNGSRREAELDRQLASLKSNLQFKENELSEAHHKVKKADIELAHKCRQIKDMEIGIRQAQEELLALKQARKAAVALDDSAKQGKETRAHVGCRSVSTQFSPENGHCREESGHTAAQQKAIQEELDSQHSKECQKVRPPLPRLFTNSGQSKRLKLMQAFFPLDREKGLTTILRSDTDGGGETYQALSAFIEGTTSGEALLSQIEVPMSEGGGQAGLVGRLHAILSVLQTSKRCRQLAVANARGELRHSQTDEDDSGPSIRTSGGSALATSVETIGRLASSKMDAGADDELLSGLAKKGSLIARLVACVESEWQAGVWESWEVKRIAIQALHVLISDGGKQDAVLYGRLVTGGGLSRLLDPPTRGQTAGERAWGEGVEEAAVEVLAMLCESEALLQVCLRGPCDGGCSPLSVALAVMDRQRLCVASGGSGEARATARRRLEGAVRLFGRVIAGHKQGLDLILEHLEGPGSASAEPRSLSGLLALLVVEETRRLSQPQGTGGEGGADDARVLREALPLLGFVNAYQSVTAALGRTWAPLMGALRTLAGKEVCAGVDDLHVMAAGLGDAMLQDMPGCEGQASQFMTQGFTQASSMP